VFIIAKTSSAPDNLTVKTWVRIKDTTTNVINTSRLSELRAVKIIKNQNDAPAVTTRLLNLGDDSSILNRINECDQSALRQCGESKHHKQQ